MRHESALEFRNWIRGANPSFHYFVGLPLLVLLSNRVTNAVVN